MRLNYEKEKADLVFQPQLAGFPKRNGLQISRVDLRFLSARSCFSWQASAFGRSSPLSRSPLGPLRASMAAFVSPIGAGALRSSSARVTLCARQRRARAPVSARRAPRAAAATPALIFDCDGVIVESEELHRLSYNECWAAAGLGFEWSYEFYEDLQNKVGGGKEKMRWYFDREGWPAAAGEGDSERADFIAGLHRDKTEMYRRRVADGDVVARAGVLRLMDEAADAGLRLAICSAASADAVSLVLEQLVGSARLARFDVVLSGDFAGDKTRKKPDPMIYNVARERLGVRAEDCVVVEDSHIGLLAAKAAGMRVLITHTPYTASQDFEGADTVVDGLGEPGDGGNVIALADLFPDLPVA